MYAPRTPDLVVVYSMLKSVTGYEQINDEFECQLKKIIDSLEAFACNRKLLAKSLYAETHKTLTLCYDTCTLSEADFDNTCYTLVGILYKLQELEELADRIFPLTYVKNEGYNPKANHRELRIRTTHVIRDMSIRNTYDVDYYEEINPFDKKEGKCINLERLDGGCIKLISATEDAVTLQWGEDEFHVDLESEVSTNQYLIDNPRLSSDSLRLTFSYYKVPNYAELWSMIAKLGCDELDGKEEKHILFARKKLSFIL